MHKLLSLTVILILCSCAISEPQSTEIDICNNNRFTETNIFSDAEITNIANITYGNAIDWQGVSTDLVMDAYFPSNTAGNLQLRPTIVLIHGGGFQSGSKEFWADECIAFAKKGFVTFTLNYRLGWDTNTPTDQVNAMYRANQDANAALRYIVANANDFRIDTNLIFVGGGSAGAVTALNMVYRSADEWNAIFPNIENELGGLNNSGNTLTTTFDIKGIFNNWGSIPNNFMQASEMVPTISFHGELDTTVPIDIGSGGYMGSRAIANVLDNNNICNELNVKPDGGHVIYSNAEGTIYRVNRASCFFKSVMCQTCTSFRTEEIVTSNCSM